MTGMSAPPMLAVDNLAAGYGSVPVLRDVSLRARPGDVVTILGANGAGKSTLLKAISGLLPLASGRVSLDGQDISGLPGHQIVSLGLLHVAEGHRIFRQMTVNENLRVALWRSEASRQEEQQRRQDVFDLFPILHERLEAKAAVLSGGEQQMLAIAQALMKRPRLLMLDEPSLGLAPRLIDMVFEVIQRLRGSGLTIVLVEQVVERALAIADTAYVIQGGRVADEGTPSELQGRDAVRRAYLGVGPSE